MRGYLRLGSSSKHMCPYTPQSSQPHTPPLTPFFFLPTHMYTVMNVRLNILLFLLSLGCLLSVHGISCDLSQKDAPEVSSTSWSLCQNNPLVGDRVTLRELLGHHHENECRFPVHDFGGDQSTFLSPMLGC